MIKITFKELLDAVGFSGEPGSYWEDTITGGASQPKSRTLLTNEVIKSAITRRIQADWAKDQMASDLLINVNDTLLIDQIRTIFQTFVEEVKAKKSIDHPLYQGRIDVKTDPMHKLLDSLNSLDKLHGDTSSKKNAKSPAAASFSFNAAKYIIELTPEEVATLDEADTAALFAIGGAVGESLIVPKSAIFMTDKKYGDLYKNNPYPVFTGIDMKIVTMTPHVITQNMTLKTLTYSMHAGLIPVSSLGRDRPKGWAKGDRTIAGTMIATITVNDPLMDLQPILYASDNEYAKATSDIWRTYLLPDQFPEFDILVLFSSEYGFNAALPIYGIKFTDTGTVMSMSDSEIEVTYTYTALDVDVIRSIAGVTSEDGTVTTFDPLANNEYLVKRERAYAGISEHRSQFEVPSLYARLDTRAREVEYNKLKNKGLNISEIISIRGILAKE